MFFFLNYASAIINITEKVASLLLSSQQEHATSLALCFPQRIPRFPYRTWWFRNCPSFQSSNLQFVQIYPRFLWQGRERPDFLGREETFPKPLVFPFKCDFVSTCRLLNISISYSSFLETNIFCLVQEKPKLDQYVLINLQPFITIYIGHTFSLLYNRKDKLHLVICFSLIPCLSEKTGLFWVYGSNAYICLLSNRTVTCTLVLLLPSISIIYLDCPLVMLGCTLVKTKRAIYPSRLLTSNSGNPLWPWDGAGTARCIFVSFNFSVSTSVRKSYRNFQIVQQPSRSAGLFGCCGSCSKTVEG